MDHGLEPQAWLLWVRARTRSMVRPRRGGGHGGGTGGAATPVHQIVNDVRARTSAVIGSRSCVP